MARKICKTYTSKPRRRGTRPGRVPRRCGACQLKCSLWKPAAPLRATGLDNESFKTQTSNPRRRGIRPRRVPRRASPVPRRYLFRACRRGLRRSGVEPVRAGFHDPGPKVCSRLGAVDFEQTNSTSKKKLYLAPRVALCIVIHILG